MFKKCLLNKWINVWTANGWGKNLWFLWAPYEVLKWRHFLYLLISLGTLIWKVSILAKDRFYYLLFLNGYLLDNVLYFAENVHIKIYVILDKILFSKHQLLKFKTKDIITRWNVSNEVHGPPYPSYMTRWRESLNTGYLLCIFLHYLFPCKSWKNPHYPSH